MISNKCYYALKAILSLARHTGAGPVTIARIAEEQEIPARFLEAILRQLKQHGVTDSVRGKDGGYVLARPPAEVRMGEVIEIFEGPLASANPQNRGVVDVFAPVWEQAERALAAVYHSLNFQQLLERDDELRRQAAAHYTI